MRRFLIETSVLRFAETLSLDAITEIRRIDGNTRVGDALVFVETDNEGLTGRESTWTVTQVQRCIAGLRPGYMAVTLRRCGA